MCGRTATDQCSREICSCRNVAQAAPTSQAAEVSARNQAPERCRENSFAYHAGDHTGVAPGFDRVIWSCPEDYGHILCPVPHERLSGGGVLGCHLDC